MRSFLVVTALLAGCAARQPPTPITVPTATPGELSVVVVAAKQTGDVQPIAVALTNGRDAPLLLDARQVYARGADEARVAPMAPAEAAQHAGRSGPPGVIYSVGRGVVTGGVLGAIGGAVAGAVRGSAGVATAAGTAAGAAVGAIGGLLAGGSGSAPDVAGFQDRALSSSTLAPGFSSTGYVYFPAGGYQTVEIVLADDTGAAVREVVPITP